MTTGAAAVSDAGSATADFNLTSGNASIVAHFSELAGGSISVRLTGAAEHNGAQTFFVAFAGGDPMDDPDTNLGATNGNIALGTFQGAILDKETWANPVFFPDGTSYQIVGIIGVDMSDGLSSGDYVIVPAKIVTVSGNMIVDVVYPDDFELQLQL